VLKKSLSLKNCQNLGIENVQANRENRYIAHPDAILFSQFSREGVFQHPQAFTLTTRSMSAMAIFRQLSSRGPANSPHFIDLPQFQS